MLKIEDVLDILSIPLLGVIPESQEVLCASNLGAPVTLINKAGAPARAYVAAARKLRGEEVVIAVPTRIRFFDRLFGRRAA
jgi:septum site-determining protein MinD